MQKIGAQLESNLPATGKAATQARILAAATELFIERGYDGTTMPEVAERAGVGRATVFWHFSDKASLFREAFTRMCAPFRESLERGLEELPPRKRLEEQLAAAEQFTREHRVEIAAFVRWAVDSPVQRDAVATTLFDMNQLFAGAITQTVAELVPESEEARLLAVGLMLAFDANLIFSIFDPTPHVAEERSAAILALARRISGEASG
jgi:AcrR family transcriptional regulator